jgi:hypothetical protein
VFFILIKLASYIAFSFQPIIISEKDLEKDIPIERKIGEKMLGNIKSNKMEIDTKEEVQKYKIDSTVKPTNLTGLQSSHIPEWLPEKDNVAIVQPIQILPHLRSKVKFAI